MRTYNIAAKKVLIYVFWPSTNQFFNDLVPPLKIHAASYNPE